MLTTLMNKAQKGYYFTESSRSNRSINIKLTNCLTVVLPFSWMNYDVKSQIFTRPSAEEDNLFFSHI